MKMDMKLMKTKPAYFKDVTSFRYVENILLVSENEIEGLTRELLINYMNSSKCGQVYSCLSPQRGVELNSRIAEHDFYIDGYRMYDNDGVWEIYCDVFIYEANGEPSKLLELYIDLGFEIELDKKILIDVIAHDFTSDGEPIELDVKDWVFYLDISDIAISDNSIYNKCVAKSREGKIKKLFGDKK